MKIKTNQKNNINSAK